jgi:hypothetical protein
MNNGFFNVFIGFACIVISFVRKNDKSVDASFLKKNIKYILLIAGVVSVFLGISEIFNTF